MKTGIFIALCYIGYVGQEFYETIYKVDLTNIPTWFMVGILIVCVAQDIKDLLTPPVQE